MREKKVPVLGFQEENFKESYLNFYADLVSAK